MERAKCIYDLRHEGNVDKGKCAYVNQECAWDISLHKWIGKCADNIMIKENRWIREKGSNIHRLHDI